MAGVCMILDLFGIRGGELCSLEYVEIVDLIAGTKLVV